MTVAESERTPQTLDFEGIAITWDARVLEPRPWTAEQGRWAAALAHDAPAGPILELCCGAGQIGLLAARLSGRDLVQVDCDEVAADYARANATGAGIVSDVRLAPMENALGADEQFGVIVVDPPWLPTALVATFPDDPVTAVDGGPDGLAVIDLALGVAMEHLAPAGHIVLQVGSDDQGDLVAETLRSRHAAAGPRSVVEVARRRCTGGVLLHLAHAETAASH